MNNYPNEVKERLTSIISEMSASSALFVKNPNKDFIRNRKLNFETIMRLLISMGGGSIYKELLEVNGYDANTATTSAFVQQRDKILPFAFEFVLHEFTKSHSDLRSYKGYRLLAIDGSGLHIPTNPNDKETFFQTQPNIKGYNLLHMNAMYDLCNRFYLDMVIQPGRQVNEHKALVNMVDRSYIKENVIVIADRFYESYNDFAHIETKGWHYVIRVKDLGSSCGILSGLHLPQGGEFDIHTHRILTRKQTNEVKAHPKIYRCIEKAQTFDFLDLHENRFYPMSFRVVRIKITDNSYETVITNLNSDDFPPNELKKLYAMRWGIETSFRELKYTIGLLHFHAKKRDSIVQEIFSRIIMYNFAEIITSQVVISKTDRKHEYKVNFTVVVLTCRRFLRPSIEDPPDVEAIIRKNVSPIRPGRHTVRKTRAKSIVSFNYRIA